MNNWINELASRFPEVATEIMNYKSGTTRYMGGSYYPVHWVYMGGNYYPPDFRYMGGDYYPGHYQYKGGQYRP
jgi:hypothetical protein